MKNFIDNYVPKSSSPRCTARNVSSPASRGACARERRNLMAGRAGSVFLPILAALLLLAAGPKVSQASIGCNGLCDSVSLVDSTPSHNGSGYSCYKLRVVNRNLDGGSIFAYRIVTPYNNASFFCNVTSGTLNPSDPTLIFNGGFTWFQNPDSSSYHSLYFWDSSRYKPGYPDTASLPPCDSGWIDICLCCGIGTYTDPFYVITYHWNPVTQKIDSCISDLYNPDWFSDACGGTGTYQCSDNCDELSVGTPFTGTGGETEICVTITRRRVGSLTGFTLYWKWPAGCSKDRWRLVSAPPGWSETSNGTDSSSYIGDGYYDVINNCESGTFCFALDSCETLCNHFTVGLHSSDDEPYFCKPTVVVYFTAKQQDDKDCCQINPNDPTQGSEVIPSEPPMQDPTTGAFTFCVDFHRTDNENFSSICINTNCDGLGRCVEPSSIPWGWHLVSHSGSTYCYTRDSASNTGCRTFDWCFQTCGCTGDNLSYTNKICVSGDTTINGINAFTEIFPPDNGICCNGVWHDSDYATVTGASPDCVTIKFFNTHWVAANAPSGCCADRCFSFLLPQGCPLSAISLSNACWTWDTSGGVVTICAGNTSDTCLLACCDSLTVTLCSTCPIGQTSWPLAWTSHDDCGTNDTGVVVYYPLSGGISTPARVAPQGMNAPEGQPNFPNPFGSETGFQTTIPFQTSATGTAYIRVMDETGRVIMKDNESVTYAGTHFFYFTGKELPAGTYYYQIEFPNGVVIVNRTMILVK